MKRTAKVCKPEKLFLAKFCVMGQFHEGHIWRLFSGYFRNYAGYFDVIIYKNKNQKAQDAEGKTLL